MKNTKSSVLLIASTLLPLLICSCANTKSADDSMQMSDNTSAPQMAAPANYADRLPQQISTNGEKLVLVDPNVHAWGAYSSNGSLMRAGLATAGGSWCSDIGRSCRTATGTFRIGSLGSPGCKSTRYPKPHGGAPMPYCMYFHGNQGLHGSYEVVEDNISHGCVRMQVQDAEWLRYNFATVGTKVVVKPY